MATLELDENHHGGEAPAATTPLPGPADVIPLRPLSFVGVVVRKADLLEAIRVYLPAAVDIASTEDGSYFWIMFEQGGPGNGAATR